MPGILLFPPVNKGLDVGLQTHATGIHYTANVYGAEIDSLMTAAVALFVPFLVPVGGSYDRFAFDLATAGTAGSVMRMGVHNNTAGSFFPSTLHTDLGTADSTVADDHDETIDIDLNRGVYWLSVTPQGAPATEPAIRGFDGNNPSVNIGTTFFSNNLEKGSQTYFQGSVSGALGAFVGGIQNNSWFAPMIALRRA